MLASFFESFLREAPHVFFVYHVGEQRVTYVNPAYERVLQGHCARVNAELPALLARIHPDDQNHAADCWQRWLAGQLREPFELRLRTLEGADQHVCLTPHQLADEAGNLQVGGLLEDITSTKQMLWHADKYNSKKNTTLEILSHELAGPFTLLQQMSEYFHDSVAPLQNAELTSLIVHMGELCRDSVKLIRDFVDQEFLESASIVLKRERVDLVEKLRLVMEQYQHGAPLVNQHFRFEAPDAPLYVDLDQNKFMQVINNLLSNALKFTPDGGTITVRVARRASEAEVTVADTGVGIPAHLQATLFEKFTPARRPGLRGERSTGLGMSIIRTLVELHEGRIRFESAEGQGSTFVISLPLSDPSPASLGA
jgi:two-component system sensor histidine kinase VicK